MIDKSHRHVNETSLDEFLSIFLLHSPLEQAEVKLFTQGHNDDTVTMNGDTFPYGGLTLQSTP